MLQEVCAASSTSGGALRLQSGATQPRTGVELDLARLQFLRLNAQRIAVRNVLCAWRVRLSCSASGCDGAQQQAMRREARGKRALTLLASMLCVRMRISTERGVLVAACGDSGVYP